MEKGDIIIFLAIVFILVSTRISGYQDGLKEGRIECLEYKLSVK